MLQRLRHRFLTRLATPEDAPERRRVERVLASARILLTFAALVASYLDPTEPTLYAELAYGILISYFVWGAYIWLHVHRVDHLRRFPFIIHVLDVAFPMAFILFTAGPNSPFFVFLLFVLTAAAFRWGFPETMWTALTVAALLLLEAALFSLGPNAGWIEGQYDLNRFIIRINYLLTLGALVGYLGEEEKQWRAESGLVNRLLSRIHGESGLRVSMQEVLSETTRIFLASRALVVLTQNDAHRIFLWRLRASDGFAQALEVEPEARSQYQVGIPAAAMYACRRARGWRSWAIGDGARAIRLPASFDPASLPEMNGEASVLAAKLSVGEEWSGHVFLYGAVTGPGVASELHFLQALLRQLSPALYSVFLVRRLRSRAGAIERARVARELHDGATQALISIEMQLDVLRRRLSPQAAPDVSSGLQRVQELLRQQIFELRMLMQQMKPVEPYPRQLLDYMADLVDRFRRDTGVAARFVTSLEEVQLPSRVARELARILQEALVNVRKHSGASNVLVRFALEDGCWKLGIVDNGRGFDFSGTSSLRELDAARRGPGVIKERVRALGGDLMLTSTPNSGSELLVTLPQKAQVIHV